jgi:cell division control protein 6
MNMESSMGLFQRYLNNRKIFRNREVLRHTYRPPTLPHRDPQIENIVSILAPALDRETPSNILIYGKTGTGKTACVRYVGHELENASGLTNTPCRVVYLNCEIIDTQYRVLAQIANELESIHQEGSDKQRPTIPMTGWPTDQVYSELLNKMETFGGVFIIVLDEIDKLVQKSGDETLYNLSRVNSELDNAKVSMIGISNDLKFTNFLDPRVRSSLGEEEIIFPPYDAEQICDILAQRAKLAFVAGALDDGVIPLCAALAAQEHGDARRALDLLRVSGELASRDNADKVSEEYVRKAQDKIEVDSMVECVSTLPTQSKAILKSMLILESIGHRPYTSGEVSLIYREIARALEIDVLTNRRISDLISELSMLGIISTHVVSRGRYGRTKEMKIDTDSTKIAAVLSRDPRFEEDRFGVIDLGRIKRLFG